jgi:predicted TIM-barrel fold metal-dependent hydrolase
MLAQTCPSVHLDTSSSNGWMRYTPGLTLSEVFETTLDVVGPDRLLFGTDSSYFPRGWQKGIYEEQAAIINQLVPSEDDRAAILGDNARRLLGMPAAKA